jgi:hypothetical protein
LSDSAWPEESDGLPFSRAAANNREPILEQLRAMLAHTQSVLEIGAGTGQHALFFAAQLPHLRWRGSEHPAAMPMLLPRYEASRLPNLDPPLALDICARPWPIDWPDAVYTANTLHIVAPTVVEEFFAACAGQAPPDSQLIIYGPFNYGGQYTSPSNADFDRWLKARDPESGIRDQEWVDALAKAAGFILQQDLAMPANNRLLQWKKTAG